jgi:hypothetical protein
MTLTGLSFLCVRRLSLRDLDMRFFGTAMSLGILLIQPDVLIGSRVTGTAKPLLCVGEPAGG